MGGLKIYPDERCLDRETALRLWTLSNSWFSNETGLRGQIKERQFADFIALSEDYFSVPLEQIKDLTSDLTVVGGKIVHGNHGFKSLAPELPSPRPDWSPVRVFGGYQDRSATSSAFQSTCCHVHSQVKKMRSSFEEVILDWSLGCSCWAF